MVRSSIKNFTGNIKSSCKGYIEFDNNEPKRFEFNEEDKEIVWYGDSAREKWIQGWFCWFILNVRKCILS